MRVLGAPNNVFAPGRIRPGCIRSQVLHRHSRRTTPSSRSRDTAPPHGVWAKDSVDESVAARAATLTEWKAFSAGPTTVEVSDGDHDFHRARSG